ncbi:MAG: DUF3048 domain-containing protein [Anaerolineae bacterium]|nr:DUF3048 domain-containing protein [Anaerolineae bacterium]MCO5203488.1 DUF3048 domain-containing protein [Anaerolineae bacterium]
MKRIILLLIMMLGLAACGQETAIPPTTTSSALPTVAPATEPPATAALPLPPTVTMAEPPTPTAVPTVTPTPTPEATATPEPIVLYTAEDFAESGRSPFTGELLDPLVVDRRPIACKISNAPAQWVRPQSGLNSADIIYEHLAEGVYTRFTALFYGTAPEKIGPIRSARLIDVEIPAMYDSALCFSGASIGVSAKLYGSDLRPRLLRSWYPGYYRTGEDKPWEHTFYADPTGFWEKLDELEENHAPELSTFMAFDSMTPEGGESAEYISIAYDKTGTFVEWRWDSERERYLRWADGEQIIDANDGEQVAAANVVTLFAPHVYDMSICELQVEDQCLSPSRQIQIWSQGFVAVYRDGQRFIGEWRRANREDMLTFYDTEGNPLPLAIGQTWIQVLPYHYDNPVTYE